MINLDELDFVDNRIKHHDFVETIDVTFEEKELVIKEIVKKQEEEIIIYEKQNKSKRRRI